MVALPGQNLTFHSTHAILQLRPRTKIVYMHMFVGKIQALVLPIVGQSMLKQMTLCIVRLLLKQSPPLACFYRLPKLAIRSSRQM